MGWGLSESAGWSMKLTRPIRFRYVLWGQEKMVPSYQLHRRRTPHWENGNCPPALAPKVHTSDSSPYASNATPLPPTPSYYPCAGAKGERLSVAGNALSTLSLSPSLFPAFLYPSLHASFLAAGSASPVEDGGPWCLDSQVRVTAT